jgi:hypothetical protein
MNDVGRDIRYALRGPFRAPLFAVFSVVNGVLLRPLPHSDGDRLVYLRHSAQLAGIDNERFSVPEIIDFREAASFTDLAEFSASSYNLTARGEPQQVLAGIVTGNFFEVMGLRPEVGRVLDDGETAAPVIVLTYDYWMRAVGLAGVLGFSVSQRTGEIGVRMSLGAEPGQVRRMVVREGVTPLLIGLVLGAVGSVFATKVVEGMLFGVAPNDPTTLVAVALLMVTVGVTAAWVPAMRASRVHPVEALRQE